MRLNNKGFNINLGLKGVANDIKGGVADDEAGDEESLCHLPLPYVKVVFQWLLKLFEQSTSRKTD